MTTIQLIKIPRTTFSCLRTTYNTDSFQHQYLIFLRELGLSERYLQDLHKNDPKLFNAFPMGNPYFDKVELELSSVFDSIIFQLSSVFDYMSHTLCYICKTNKSDTLYWTKLASSVRDKNNEFSKLDIAKVIDSMDREFIGKLYDYRSRLLHNKRDQHRFMTTVTLSTFDFNLRFKSLAQQITKSNLLQNERIQKTYL
jgi:hypothetical protein